ncbi:hypothetical protein FE391_08455 [Nonomuraea sp. KC401]|uniref:hypothetical protein n=1 Tax=unclassified Nonomuraea TaxID=2593643 RepID=UPI0010FD14F5|nr:MULTISPECIES: hypothetical protein [unclassified Nonomuraea]NBE93970.1 hypothetical protein [Nonomuraea sp. K271]TLF80221.1 hypothetical protein FE391_08455 [Nonomuraea sp. KC401]
MKFRLIHAEKDHHEVSLVARVLGVSRQGYRGVLTHVDRLVSMPLEQDRAEPKNSPALADAVRAAQDRHREMMDRLSEQIEDLARLPSPSASASRSYPGHNETSSTAC